MSELDRDFTGMPLLPPRRCAHCGGLINGEPVLRAVLRKFRRGPRHQVLDHLHFCSAACEKHSRIKEGR